MLLNKLEVAQFFNTDYNDEFTKEFPVGDTVRIKYPQRFLIREGLGYAPQGIARRTTSVTIDQVFGVDFEWDSAEAALKLERGRDKIKSEYLDPAAAQLAQEVDSRCALWALRNTNHIVGQLGTDPTSFATISGLARQRMIEMAATPGEKGMIIPPKVNTALVNAGVAYFNPSSEISKQYKEGSIGRQAGFDWYESMSLWTHTAGTWAGTVELSAALADGASTAALTATTGDTFKKGDVFHFQNVYEVNPSTRRSTGVLKQFVITADATAAASAATISFQPAIAGPGSQYQNVDSLPANGADLTLFPGTTSPNGKSGVNGLAIGKNAFALVGVKLETPKAVELSSNIRDPKTGLAVRFIRMFDPQQSKMINRFDVAMGFGNLYPDNDAVRVLSA